MKALEKVVTFGLSFEAGAPGVVLLSGFCSWFMFETQA
jgi:hypothetical protein